MVRTLVALGLLALLASAAAPAFAQNKPPVRVRVQGSVVGIAPGFIHMVTNKGVKHAIKIPADKKVVTVTGTLAREQLGPGMIVRFSGVLTGSMIEQPLEELTVYTPNDGFLLGILQDESTPIPLVTAQVKSIKGDVLSVMVGRKQVTAKLSENLAIKVNTGDYSVVPVGAAIDVGGRLTVATGQIAPQKVDIVLPAPVVAEPKPKRAPPASKDPPASEEE